MTKNMILCFVVTSLALFLAPLAWSADAPAPAKLTPKDVLYFQNFDQSPLGPYTSGHLSHDWKRISEVTPPNPGSRVQIFEGPDAYRGRSLRLTYPKGTASGPMPGGACWVMDLGKGNQEMFCSYMVKFAKDFEFVQGGKLPGLAGGRLLTPGIGAQNNGWGEKILWNAGWRKSICNYVYHLDQKDKYGDFFWLDNAGKTVAFVPGQWTHVEQHVVMNTIGKRDGVLQTWINGVLVMDKHDMRWRLTPTIAVDMFVFTSFFGGSGPDYESKKEEHAWFDEFVISRKHAGPLGPLPKPEDSKTTPDKS